MKAELFNENIQKWINLSRNGMSDEAERFYFEQIFQEVLNKFINRYSTNRTDELLVSLLGLSPEPLILTAKATNPKTHLIITNPVKREILDTLTEYLKPGFKLVTLENDDFKTIYRTIKEALSDYPTQNITIDITGGKKSMVASASIFGKDYGSRIVYVDFEEYLKDLRKPLPGSEFLNIVYDPLIDQPEISI